MSFDEQGTGTAQTGGKECHSPHSAYFRSLFVPRRHRDLMNKKAARGSLAEVNGERSNIRNPQRVSSGPKGLSLFFFLPFPHGGVPTRPPTAPPSCDGHKYGPSGASRDVGERSQRSKRCCIQAHDQ